MKSPFYSAVAFLICTVIGAGIFGLPYVFVKAGFFIGLILFIFLSFITIIVTLAFSEVVLNTKTRHHIPGYAQIYLGRTGKFFSFISLVAAFVGALTAYMIGVGNFLSYIFFGDSKLWSLIFFVVAALLVFRGLSMITAIEKKLTLVTIFIVLLIFCFSFKSISVDNFFHLDWRYFFLPYGVILFALGGATAVPDMAFILKKNREELRKAIFIGLIIPQLIYLIFVVSIVGIAGANTGEDAIRNLGGVASWLMYAGAALGILTMSTSFFASGIVLKEIFIFDAGLSKNQAWIISMGLPLILFSFSSLGFVEVLGIAGAITSGFDSIIIMLMHQRISKIAYSRFMSGLIYAIFSLGMLYQIYLFSFVI